MDKLIQLILMHKGRLTDQRIVVKGVTLPIALS
jgi:hypothetical protein